MRSPLKRRPAKPGRRSYAGAVGGLLAIGLALLAAGCAVGSGSPAGAAGASPTLTATVPAAPLRPRPGAPIEVRPRNAVAAWTQVASVGGVPAIWIARHGGVTLLRLNQNAVHLALHAGSAEPGVGGWKHGDRIEGSEVHRVLAAFNSGFKLGYGHVGYMLGGRVAVPLGYGLGSVVTYRDGQTQIGPWKQGVPEKGRPIASVRQNLYLLVDHAKPASTVRRCVIACWGKTIYDLTRATRSGLGINAAGELIWAAGQKLNPAHLAEALIGAGAVRAVELDINGGWVAGYLYVHHPPGPRAVAVVPGQSGIPGKYLVPYIRDFFTVLAN